MLSAPNATTMDNTRSSVVAIRVLRLLCRVASRGGDIRSFASSLRIACDCIRAVARYRDKAARSIECADAVMRKHFADNNDADDRGTRSRDPIAFSDLRDQSRRFVR